MTDQRLPCRQITEEVAEMLGWRRISGWWFPRDGDTRSTGKPYLPDYCGKWEHAGPLLEEMCEEMRRTDAADFPAEYQEGARYFNKLFGLILKMVWEFGMTTGVTRAFHAWKKENE